MRHGPAAPPRGTLLHRALGPCQGVSLAAADLDERQRMGVLLQAAAVLSHLRRAGWRLGSDLARASVRSGELLCGLRTLVGLGEDGAAPLRSLLAQLFGDGAGRSAGARAARELQQRWGSELVPLHPDQAVADVLAAAPFLWEPRAAGARRALAAAWQVDGRVEAWVAGPEAAARRLLAAARTLPELEEVLGSADAQQLWRGEGSAVAALRARSRRLAGSGRVSAERRARRAGDPLDGVRALMEQGRFDSALARLDGDGSAAARVLAAWCQFHLGREGAARHALAQLADERLAGDLRRERAELGVQLALEAGEPEVAEGWARSLDDDPEQGWRAALLRAEVALAQGDAAALSQALRAAAPPPPGAPGAWRWQRLQAVAASRGGDTLAPALEALRRRRRELGAVDAAGLWEDVATARLRSGDLLGAERAAAHAVLLLRGAPGSPQRRRVLRRLVEARLRRGRLVGVATALEQIRAEESLVHAGRTRPEDAALRARLELVRGRPGAALQICEAALGRGGDGGGGELAVLAARALGWLGRGEDARGHLERADLDPATVLEAEELPALWAHAGERERAVTAAGGALRGLWEAVLAGSHPARGRWGQLESLEPYRTARLVYDCERLTPGLVPVPWVRRAIATLRRVGADELAAQLDGRLGGPWEALYAHLAETTHDEDGLHRLFAAAGAEQVWIAVRTADGEHVLLPGPGGDEELVAPLGDGQLVLRSPRLDPVIKALFRLLLRQLPVVQAAAAGQPVPGIVGESPALLAALARLPRLAAGEVPIMVLGESGTGKELVARQVHRLSPRAGGPFLPINCAALSESLLLSDLFGHARGAFTGADRDRQGIFEAARGGTVFLDEIGDLPLAAQGKLLRVLQEKEVRRLGESAPRTVDVRVVTATHRDLQAMVQGKTFREDLFYRLRVAVIELPPLRERGRDVLLLAEHVLARTSRGRRPARLSRKAREKLLGHRWPGNVRELENVLEVAAALADFGTIEPEHVQLPESRPAAASGSYHQQVEAFRRRLVEDALSAAGGSRAEAARRLGLTRQALSYLVRHLRIVEA